MIRRGRLIGRIAAALAAGGIVVAGVAQVSAAPDPSQPRAETGSAADIRLHTATLHGTVDPNGAETTYRFRYGRNGHLTKATPARSAGGGTTEVAVTAPVGGLSWGRTYQYRLVAENADGSDAGATREFRTWEPRVQGRYLAHLRVTSGGDPFGQRRGMRVERTYRLYPRNCGGGSCGSVRLNREGKHGHFRYLLKHRSRGVFVGSDRFRGRCDNGLRFRSRAKTRLEVRAISEVHASALGGSLHVRARGCIHGKEKAKLKATAR
jgi:hypothetical protein